MKTLEQRIAACLTDNATTSGDIASIIAEVQAEASEASRQVELERAISSDASAAEVSRGITEKEIIRSRLRASLPALQHKLDVTYAEEREADYMKERARVEKNVEVAAEAFAEIPKLIEAIIERLLLAEKTDAEVSILNRSAPSGWASVLGPELKARGLSAFSASHPRMSRDMKLPDWNSSQLLWPRRPPAPTVATGVIIDDRFNSNWGKLAEERKRRVNNMIDADLAAAVAAKVERNKGF